MIAIAMALLLASACFAQPALPVEFDGDDSGWVTRPTYLGNPAENPEIIAGDGAVTMRVTEAGKGMKFALGLRPFDTDSVAYLVVRYRAKNLGPGYAIWIIDEVDGGHQLLGTEELTQDGGWHVVAVNLWARGAAGFAGELMTEVQCGGEPAEIAFDYMRLSDQAPEGATMIPQRAPDEEELVLRPADLIDAIEAKPEWLGSGAKEFGAEAQDGVLRLHAEGQGKGMKWSVMLPEPIDLGKFRYAAIRYRARNIEPWGDYFIWLGSEGGGMPQQSAHVMVLGDVQDDDTWRVVVAGVPEDFEAVNMALEVSSSGEMGEAWIDTIRFSVRRPLVDIQDVLPTTPGWEGARLPAGSFAAIDLSARADARPQDRLRALGLKTWLPAGKVTARGIPFELLEGEVSAVRTTEDITETASVPVGRSGSEAYLLLAAKLPRQDFARMGKGRPMRAFSNPERFVVEVEYEDGITDEMFPVCVGRGTHQVHRGVDVYCLAGLRSAAIRRIGLRNKMDTAQFMLAGLTLNQGEALTQEPAVTGLPPASRPRLKDPGAGRVMPTARGYVIENDLARMELQTEGGICVLAIANHCVEGAKMQIEPGPLFEIGDGETLLTSEEVAVGEASITRDGDATRLAVPVDGTRGGVPLRGELVVTVGDGPDILMRLELSHAGDQAFMPVVNFPLIKGMRIGSVEDTWYLWCRKGGIINNLPTHDRQSYGGQYPLQVADVFNPEAGGGLALLTYDLEDIYRFWDLRKDDSGVSWRMDYYAREYQPGERIEIAPTALRAHTGDWRRALEIYEQWAHSWYKPQVAPNAWFQKAFYYQQTWAWGNLRDRKTGKWRMAEVIDEYRDYFGCLDYLHIFDFGESKVYGRTGDYNHYEELGGLAAMRAAIKEAQDMGVPVGLYIEGYLCDERCEWGEENVLAHDVRSKDGSSRMWPESREHVMCGASAGWRDHLVGVYERAARDLQPNGLYIDEYGFIGAHYSCWSRDHGHPVPWAPIRGERDTTRAIRAGVPDDIAILTEETPNDVNSQHQDGALGYSVTWSNPTLMPHRVDLFRFTFPSFKVFQLVQYNDFREGGWHLLKFPFFNGEGYWLHHGTTRGYCDDAHRFLKKAFAILNRYEDAFCSSDVEPLTPTLRPTVYANRFSSKDHTVWTLFNAEFRTSRGDCLRVAHKPGTRYVNAFTGEEIAVRVEDGMATIPMELGPRMVGCVVKEAGR